MLGGTFLLTLIMLLLIIGYVFFIRFLWLKILKPIIRQLKDKIYWIYLINVIYMLPCIYFAYQNSITPFYRPEGYLLKLLFWGAIISRFFLLPQIISVLLTIEYINVLKARNYPRKEVALFVLLLLLCILCLCGMEHIFGWWFSGVMSV